MTSPLVSFVIVTHDRAKWVTKAIRSIQQQTIDCGEIVVVVNGRDEETETALRTIGQDVRTTFLDANYGVGTGRNAGIQLARGEVLFFLDDDAELYQADAAARALNHFRRDSDLAVVGFLVLDTTDTVERRSIPFRDKRVPRSIAPACYFVGTACAIHRRALDRVGFFDGSLFYGGEELDLSYRLLDAGFQIVFDPSVVVVHHRTGGPTRSLTPYYDARNRPLVALRHLPLLYCATHIFAWWARSLAKGLYGGQMLTACRGIYDCVTRMPAVWRKRRTISRRTHRLLADNGGRLWY
ncbi:MAG: hypothetical protein C3F08_10475 [Candidatus Methylomirabilota bacterium]|nr:MAG: hypothetical protein C3F08_10475 [candidate division NC10 bacterium]